MKSKLKYNINYQMESDAICLSEFEIVYFRGNHINYVHEHCDAFLEENGVVVT